MSNEWFERGELPPVGVELEVFNKEFGGAAAWEKCTLLFSGQFICVYSSESCAERSAKVNYLKFRPILTEREKAIQAACKFVQGGNMAAIFGQLYDAGLLRLPEDKK